jgi:hypothetical protein
MKVHREMQVHKEMKVHLKTRKAISRKLHAMVVTPMTGITSIPLCPFFNPAMQAATGPPPLP